MKCFFSRRTPTAWLLATLCLLAATPSRAADDSKKNWKLVLKAFGADDLAVIHFEYANDPKAVLLDAQKKMIGDVELKDFKFEKNRVSFELKGPEIVIRFGGDVTMAGALPGSPIKGTLKIREQVFPASLELTDAEKVAEPETNPVLQDIGKAMRQADAKDKARELQELITRNGGSPSSHVLYPLLFGAASEAKLPAAEVEKAAETWIGDAKPYGPAWVDVIRLKALQSLAPSKEYADTALKIGREADKSMAADAPLELRAAVVELLAKAAKNAGAAGVAKDAEARSTKLEGQLDAEYHEKVPPFKPTPFEGRKQAGADRVVVFELFTGAQCPPCVAADVAFDALLKTYKPTELIGLQYHLHIPGPDPLTNSDTLARQEYYGRQINGTPSTFFNGRSDAAGGGMMSDSEEKYKEYRGLVDELLARKARADVKVTAARDGDQIAITADASKTADADAPKQGERASDRLSLRLALTEEAIRYVGSNRLRFHHHVVRALPGGADGKRLVDGKGRVEVKVNLADLKRELEDYLSRAAKDRPFPGDLPEIALKNLSVVAFVQDDADQSILGAATVHVAEPTP